MFRSVIRCALFMVTMQSVALALPYGDDTVDDALIAAEKRIKGKKLHNLIMGTWKVEVPDDLKREIAILEIALRPTSQLSDIDALTPTDAEREGFRRIQDLLSKAPDHSELLLARSKLEALNQNSIHFETEKVTIKIAGAERVQTYKVINAHTNALQIYWIETNELNDCVFINANTLRIFEGGQEKVRLSRL